VSRPHSLAFETISAFRPRSGRHGNMSSVPGGTSPTLAGGEAVWCAIETGPDPALYSALNGDMGTAREALVAALCAGSGWSVEAARRDTEGDFVISRGASPGGTRKYTIEVGGASKKPKQADFVIRDDTDYPAGKSIPLWLLGFSY
jgi:hypothetical protein